MTKNKFIKYIKEYCDEHFSNDVLLTTMGSCIHILIPYLEEKKVELIRCFIILNKNYTIDDCFDMFDKYIKYLRT